VHAVRRCFIPDIEATRSEGERAVQPDIPCLKAATIAAVASCLALGAQGMAAAQEKCSLGWTLTTQAGGATLYELEDCESTITMFACSRPEHRITIVLPGFARTIGKEETITFTVDGRSLRKVAKVVAPDEGLKAAMTKEGTFSRDARGYALSIAPEDPLWKALMRPRADVPYAGDGWVSSLFIDRTGAKNLRTMAATCGL
jgi:hypothetical protein